MEKSTKSRFWAGVLMPEFSLFKKSAGKVSNSLPMDAAIEILGMTEQEIRRQKQTYKIDSVTYVQI